MRAPPPPTYSIFRTNSQLSKEENTTKNAAARGVKADAISSIHRRTSQAHRLWYVALSACCGIVDVDVDVDM